MSSVLSRVPSNSLAKPIVKTRPFLVRPVLRVVWRHLKRYRWSISAIFIGTIVVQVAQTVALPYIAKLLFDTLAKGGGNSSLLQEALRILRWFVGVNILVWLTNRVLMYNFVTLQPKMMADLEQTGFTYLLGHSYQFFQNNFSGALVRRLTRLGKAFEEIMDTTQEKLLPVLISFIGILCVLFYRNWLIGAIVLVWVVIMGTYNILYSQWKVRHDVERAEQDSKCTGFLSDAISNIITIKLFSAGKREAASYEAESKLLRDMRLKSWTTHTKNYAIQALILLFLQAGVLWLGLS